MDAEERARDRVGRRARAALVDGRRDAGADLQGGRVLADRHLVVPGGRQEPAGPVRGRLRRRHVPAHHQGGARGEEGRRAHRRGDGRAVELRRRRAPHERRGRLPQGLVAHGQPAQHAHAERPADLRVRHRPRQRPGLLHGGPRAVHQAARGVGGREAGQVDRARRRRSQRRLELGARAAVGARRDATRARASLCLSLARSLARLFCAFARGKATTPS